MAAVRRGARALPLTAVDPGALDGLAAVLLRAARELMAGGQHPDHGGSDDKTKSLLASHGAPP